MLTPFSPKRADGRGFLTENFETKKPPPRVKLSLKSREPLRPATRRLLEGSATGGLRGGSFLPNLPAPPSSAAGDAVVQICLADESWQQVGVGEGATARDLAVEIARRNGLGEGESVGFGIVLHVHSKEPGGGVVQKALQGDLVTIYGRITLDSTPPRHCGEIRTYRTRCRGIPRGDTPSQGQPPLTPPARGSPR